MDIPKPLLREINNNIAALADSLTKFQGSGVSFSHANMMLAALSMRLLEDAEHIEPVKARYCSEDLEKKSVDNYPNAYTAEDFMKDLARIHHTSSQENTVSSEFTKHDSMKIRMGEVVSAALKLGVDKIPADWINLFDDKFLLDTAGVLAHGAAKYSPDNWKKCSQEEALERYGNAAMRHAYDITQGNLVDDDSKHLHAAHIACNAMFLIYFSLRDSKAKGGNSVTNTGCDGK